MNNEAVKVDEAAYGRPVPKIEPEAAPYWESLRQHQMKVQRCDACQEWMFPPTTLCPFCYSEELSWHEVSGRGSVWACVTMHRAYLPAYQDDVPYNVSIVELEEGPRVWSNVVGVAPSDIQVGMPVKVRYDDVTDGLTLARFVEEQSG